MANKHDSMYLYNGYSFDLYLPGNVVDDEVVVTRYVFSHTRSATGTNLQPAKVQM